LVDKTARVSIDLVVAKNGDDMNLYLEDINAAA
jgi:hypothetical protein